MKAIEEAIMDIFKESQGRKIDIKWIQAELYAKGFERSYSRVSVYVKDMADKKIIEREKNNKQNKQTYQFRMIKVEN